METIIKYAEYLVKLEFMKTRLEVFTYDSGSSAMASYSKLIGVNNFKELLIKFGQP